jgi:hypothetical protein
MAQVVEHLPIMTQTTNQTKHIAHASSMRVEVWSCPLNNIPAGFLWVIPTGPQQENLGLC